MRVPEDDPHFFWIMSRSGGPPNVVYIIEYPPTTRTRGTIVHDPFGFLRNAEHGSSFMPCGHAETVYTWACAAEAPTTTVTLAASIVRKARIFKDSPFG